MFRTILLAVAMSPLALSAQQVERNPFTESYKQLIAKAETLYEGGDYRGSGETYAKAFANIGGKGILSDRYNAACAWSMAGNKDSAFSQLKIAANGRYRDYNHLMIDPDLETLQRDKRWEEIRTKVKANREMDQVNRDQALVDQLDQIVQDDQRERMRLARTEKQFGRQSKEMKDLWKKIAFYDSVNVIRVSSMIDKDGWPGIERAGYDCSKAAFLVIQHAEKEVQEKYLPVMRNAVKDGQADAKWLALLEDRVALEQGKKQIYGSQVSRKGEGPWELDPLEDPDNVDARRASVGLEPLEKYLKGFDIKWDLAAYKKQQERK